MCEFPLIVRLPGETFENAAAFFARARDMEQRISTPNHVAQAIQINPYNKTFRLLCETKEVYERAKKVLGQ